MNSIICGVMNRGDALAVSLHSWLLLPKIKEIIIVDWSSNKPLRSISNLDSRIKIVRVDDKQHFNLGVCYNLASDFVTTENILKLDADYIINPYYNFMDIYKPDEKCFITGHWSNPPPFFSYVNGLLFVKKNHFVNVDGYNEYLFNYGYDDEDIFSRLEKAGLFRRKISIDPAYAFHIPHSDWKRLENYSKKDLMKSHNKNVFISSQIKYTKRIYGWEIEQIDEQYYTAKDFRKYSK